MSFLIAMALAAASSAQAVPPAAADPSRHGQHQQQGQKEEGCKCCKDMMAKMHKGMNHGEHDKAGNAGAEHQGRNGH